MKVTIAALDKQENSVKEKLIEVLRGFIDEQVRYFGLISPVKTIHEKSLDLLNRQSSDTSAAVAYVSSNSASKGYAFLQLNDVDLVLQGNIYSPVMKKVLQQKLAKEPQHCEATLQTLIEEADGDYAFFMIKKGWIAAGRDPVGVQPLYYGENEELAAFSSNRRALWLLGIENPASFPPGNLAFVDQSGFQFKQVKALSFAKPQPITMENAARKLQVLLEESIRRRTHDVKKAAVAFSGGLDSTLVAFIAAKQGLEVNLLHISMENEAEIEEAVDAAEQLNLPLQVHLYKDSNVEKTLPKVVELIEEADPIKASIGLAFFWTAEKAAETGLHVVLAGQGADELFGGYQRYINEYCKEGSEKVLRTMFNDVVNIHLSNLERDLKVTGYHDVELRLPFAWFDLAEFAVGLPIECKIEPKPDTLRKLVLRKVALDAGMPRSVVDKPKKAVQYSTGINDAIKRVAKRHGKTVAEYISELFQQSKI